MSAPNGGALPPLLDLLTTSEAAKLLRIGTSTLERMRLDGTGPAFHKAGIGERRRVLYSMRDLEDWLNEHRFSSTSQYSNRSK